MMHTENVTYRNILGVKVACFDWNSAFTFSRTASMKAGS